MGKPSFPSILAIATATFLACFFNATFSSFDRKVYKPVDPNYASGKFIIHDMPPYNSDTLRSLVQRADKIIVPVRVSIADLVALKTAVDLLRATDAVHRSIVVLTEFGDPIQTLTRMLELLF